MALQPVLDVLAEPHRRRILELLLQRPRPVAELVEALGLSQPGTSKHLRVLRERSLVRARVVGKQRVYEVRPGPLRALDAWLEPYRRMWSASLDRLEHELDAIASNEEDER